MYVKTSCEHLSWFLQQQHQHTECHQQSIGHNQKCGKGRVTGTCHCSPCLQYPQQKLYGFNLQHFTWSGDWHSGWIRTQQLSAHSACCCSTSNPANIQYRCVVVSLRHGISQRCKCASASGLFRQTAKYFVLIVSGCCCVICSS